MRIELKEKVVPVIVTATENNNYGCIHFEPRKDWSYVVPPNSFIYEPLTRKFHTVRGSGTCIYVDDNTKIIKGSDFLCIKTHMLGLVPIKVPKGGFVPNILDNYNSRRVVYNSRQWLKYKFGDMTIGKQIDVWSEGEETHPFGLKAMITRISKNKKDWERLSVPVNFTLLDRDGNPIEETY